MNFEFFNISVLGWASPLTYQILGHIKSIIILIFGITFYDAVPSYKSILGMSLAMVGVVIYTEENRQQQNAKQTQYIPLREIDINKKLDDNNKSENVDIPVLIISRRPSDESDNSYITAIANNNSMNSKLNDQMIIDSSKC